MLGVMLWLCSGGFLQGSKAAAWDFALRGSTPGCVLFAETRLADADKKERLCEWYYMDAIIWVVPV
ncbi:predicted protein [Histoplasma mississippiense (nom. inval.)]|uniref:predicted protein n=1 Tax=Ajellomyces capsulatus (strain NAm1 / WU24) TaxID=2059318 RepID=UPI000157D070|nr:predicted protein [Histoplasma mississippiense (nom. inval.)]EDN10838.1 predicted protein [Histoplasma mississippiense (nom. inval.)]